jgi:hypothetical protein
MWRRLAASRMQLWGSIPIANLYVGYEASCTLIANATRRAWWVVHVVTTVDGVGIYALLYTPRVTAPRSSLLYTCQQSGRYCRCSVAASNGGPSLFSEFPNCPRASATATQHTSQVTTAQGSTLETSSERLSILNPLEWMRALAYDVSAWTA